jgi:hypothetical protein
MQRHSNAGPASVLAWQAAYIIVNLQLAVISVK